VLIPRILKLVFLLGLCAVLAGRAASPSDYETTEYNAQGGLGLIKASTAYSLGSTATNIVIAVIDSGLDVNHPEFNGQIAAGGYDYVANTSNMTDANGHGTHVAGIIAALRNSTGMMGVAFNAKIVPFRTINAADMDDADSKAVNRAVDTLGIRIMNNSWSEDPEVKITSSTRAEYLAALPKLIGAYSNAVNKSSIIVFAAGNSNYTEVASIPGLPYLFPEFQNNWLTVVAVDETGTNRAPYSNAAGVCKEFCVSAPGGGDDQDTVGIYSTKTGGGYTRLSGTSMAAPYVSAVAALVKGTLPYLTGPQVIEVIKTTCTDLGAPGVDNIFGHGLVNAGMAVKGYGSFRADVSVDTQGYDSTWGNNISGTNGLTKAGSGLLTLTGTNTFSGGTILNAGGFGIGNDSALGTGTLTINGGNLRAIDASRTMTNAVTVGGNFTVDGSQALTLNGNMNLGGAVRSITVDNTAATTFGGILSGAGGVTKLGSGSLMMSGANTYTGNTQVDAGALIYNGTWGAGAGSAITIGSSGLFGGIGTWKGNLLNDGMVRPSAGGTVGKLTVNGTYGGSGNLGIAFASATSYDQLETSGNISLANTTLQPSLSGGYVPQSGTAFTNIVQSTGGTLGSTQFASIQPVSVTLVATPTYRASAVDVTIVRQYRSAAAAIPSASANEAAAYNMIADVSNSDNGDLETVLDEIDEMQTSEEVEQAMGEISPEKALTTLDVAADSGMDNQFYNIGARLNEIRMGALNNFRIDPATGTYSGTLYARRSEQFPLLAFNGDLHDLVLTGSRQPDIPRWGWFVNGSGTWGDQDQTAERTGYTFQTGGFTTGMDYRLADRLYLGVATGYSHTLSHMGGSGGEVQVDTLPACLYTSYALDGFYVNAVAGYAHSTFDIRRNIQVGALNRVGVGEPEGHHANASVDLGYDFPIGPFSIGPAVSMQYSRLWIDAYDETGAGALDLSYQDQTIDSLQSGLGARFSYEHRFSNLLLVPTLSVFWQHEFSRDGREVQAQIPGGSWFTTRTPDPERDFALLGAGATLVINDTCQVGVNYSTEVGRSDYIVHSVNGGVRVLF
jgi:autotransporter-associated beta strand protein